MKKDIDRGMGSRTEDIHTDSELRCGINSGNRTSDFELIGGKTKDLIDWVD